MPDGRSRMRSLGSRLQSSAAGKLVGKQAAFETTCATPDNVKTKKS